MRAPSSRRFRTLLVLASVAALARLLLQGCAMPPYAGLDEAFHVSRLAFVRAEGRQPSSREPSVPSFIVGSTEALPGSPPDFALSGAAWPGRARSAPWPDPVVWPDRVRPWTIPNYEAQHPSLYYAIAGRLGGILGVDRQLQELTLQRLFSVFCALVLVLAAAALAARFSGRAGFLAAAFLPLLPTWLTLVARTANDALAGGLLGVALVLSARRETRKSVHVLEGLAWAGALAVKLTTWPALIAIPILQWRDAWRSKGRIAVVGLFAFAAIGLTLADLKTRTGIAVGSQAFRPASEAAGAAASLARGPIAWGAWAKVFVASAIWTPGQHGNALRPIGMLIYAGVPIAAMALFFLLEKRKREETREREEPNIFLRMEESPRARLASGGSGGAPRSPIHFLSKISFSLSFPFSFSFSSFRERKGFSLGAALLIAFLVAHAVNAAGFIRRAYAQGIAMPQGGNEGWYLYANGAAIVLLASVLFRRSLRHPLLLAALVLWFLAWDIRLHEGALFRDYAGLTSPEHPSALFRWGPDPSVVLRLSRISDVSAAGAPFAALVALRLVHVAATLALLVVVLRPKRFARATPP